MRLKGALVMANQGTLLINGIEHLTMRAQYMIYRIFSAGLYK